MHNTLGIIALFNNSGFVLHPDKLVLYPTERLLFLGFVLDSIIRNMQISFTDERACNVKIVCQQPLLSSGPFIGEVASVLGLFNLRFSGVMFGALHYRWSEINKTQVFSNSKGKFVKPMRLSHEVTEEL